MGRLNKILNKLIITNNKNNEDKKDVHIFIDDNGNVTQIEKKNKDRIKFCVEPEIPISNIEKQCVIGINDPLEGDCSAGIGLGFGDNDYGYAIYETDF